MPHVAQRRSMIRASGHHFVMRLRTARPRPAGKRGDRDLQMGWMRSGDSLTVTLVVNARAPGTHQHCNRPGRPSDPNCANNSAAVQTRVIGKGR